ncbi:MAG: HalOD1 output domain-containing protein [Halorientalis sp.]
MSEGDDSPTEGTRWPGERRDVGTTPITVSNVESFRTLEYDRASGSYRTHYDASIDSPSLAVVSAVAALAGVSLTDLPPLYRTIDPDALDTLWNSPDDPGNGTSLVSFSFAEYSITLSRHGLLSIAPSAQDVGTAGE